MYYTILDVNRNEVQQCTPLYMRAADEHGESHAFGAGRNLKAHQSISVHLTRGRSRWGFGDPPKELEFVLLLLPGTFLPY